MIHISLDDMLRMLEADTGEVERMTLAGTSLHGFNINVVFCIARRWHTQTYFVSRNHSAHYRLLALAYNP